MFDLVGDDFRNDVEQVIKKYGVYGTLYESIVTKG